MHFFLYIIPLHIFWYSRITPVLKQLHRLPVRYRIVFKILLLVYKALNGTAPSYISELLKYRTSERKLRSSSQHLLATLKARLKTYREIAFAVTALRLWNSIPLELRSSKTKLIAMLVLRQKGKIYWPIFQLAELVFFRASA